MIGLLPLLLIVIGIVSVGGLVAEERLQPPFLAKDTINDTMAKVSPRPTPTQAPSPTPTLQLTHEPTQAPTPIPIQTPLPTKTVVSDSLPEAGSPGGLMQDTFNALNSYRSSKGKPILSWDGKLAAYAQSRAASFQAAGMMDDHAGISDFIYYRGGLQKLGFYYVGENSGFNFPGLGTDIVEHFFTGDQAHDSNQLDSKWSAVGIGIAGNFIDLVFGGDKI